MKRIPGNSYPYGWRWRWQFRWTGWMETLAWTMPMFVFILCCVGALGAFVYGAYWYGTTK